MFCLFVFPAQYMSKVEPWCKACGEGELPTELQDLEDTIHHHQGLYEHITTAYSEVSTQQESIKKKHMPMHNINAKTSKNKTQLINAAF